MNGDQRSIRKIGNIRLVHGGLTQDLSSIFSEAAHLMSEIVHGNLIHFKYDELYLLVERNETNELSFCVALPIIGNLQNRNLQTKDLLAGELESASIEIEKLREYKLIGDLYQDLALTEETFIRISSDKGEYKVFCEKYLLQ